MRARHRRPATQMTSSDGAWHPGIGDPTLLGWATVVAYAVAALVCWQRHLASAAAPRVAPRFWFWLALLLLLLGVNKQLDLQTALTNAVHWLADVQGWYEHRHPVQIAFITAIGIGGVVLLVHLLRMAWPPGGGRVTAIVGIVFLVVFVFVRASSFHHVDFALARELLGVHWNVILELGGITGVTAGALIDWLAAPAAARQ